MRVDLLPQLVSPGIQKVMRLVRYLASLALCGFFAYAGYRYVLFTYGMGIVSPKSNLPVWAVFMLVPVTMGFFCLRYVILILREAHGEETGRPEFSQAAREPAE